MENKFSVDRGSALVSELAVRSTDRCGDDDVEFQIFNIILIYNIHIGTNIQYQQ